MTVDDGQFTSRSLDTARFVVEGKTGTMLPFFLNNDRVEHVLYVEGDHDANPLISVGAPKP